MEEKFNLFISILNWNIYWLLMCFIILLLAYYDFTMIKGIVHLNINILSSFTHPQVIQVSLFCLTQNKIFFTSVGNQTVSGPHWLP